MQELKSKTMSVITQINQDWVDALKEGEKGDGVDLSEVFGKFSANVEKLDQAFREAMERLGGKKKKGMWG